jgi:hypothetical protein
MSAEQHSHSGSHVVGHQEPHHETHGPHEIHLAPSWIDRFWPWLVIAFGLIFVLTMALFHPHW